RDTTKCVDCDLCLKSCEGASDPDTQLRKSECFVCFNCIEDCPEDALSFKFMPPLKREVTAPVVPGRRAFLGTLIGLGFYAFGRTSGAKVPPTRKHSAAKASVSSVSTASRIVRRTHFRSSSCRPSSAKSPRPSCPDDARFS